MAETRKQKQFKNVDHGKVYIVATFNNTIITITDLVGHPLVVTSTGAQGFTGTRKSTPHAATMTTEVALTKAKDQYGMRHLDVYVKGIGPGREASIRCIKGSGMDVEKLTDITPVPHNGVRPPKIRRV